ncbi:hypothetical protein PPGU19_028210 [Paraburkholderia sp. PGU19]|nr:hypothetical protein PPGU19_028210 [Paraburkholderia sp. PGU19]
MTASLVSATERTVMGHPHLQRGRRMSHSSTRGGACRAVSLPGPGDDLPGRAKVLLAGFRVVRVHERNSNIRKYRSAGPETRVIDMSLSAIERRIA